MSFIFLFKFYFSKKKPLLVEEVLNFCPVIGKIKSKTFVVTTTKS